MFVMTVTALTADALAAFAITIMIVNHHDVFWGFREKRWRFNRG